MPKIYREAKSVRDEKNFIKSIASFLNNGDMTNEKDCEASEMVDNAGDLSGNPKRTGDGLASGSGVADDYGKNTKEAVKDGDEADPATKGGLDTPTVKIGSHTVVPPYNKEASPETDPSKTVPNYEPPTRDEMTPTAADDKESEDPEMTMSEAQLKACAYISEKERDKVPDEDMAGPKGSRSFPIRNGKDVEDAARLVGHSPNPSQTKKRIIEIAHRKGLQAHLPESWKKPEHQTASTYEQAVSLFGKLSADEKKTLADKLEWKEMCVNGPQEDSTSS